MKAQIAQLHYTRGRLHALLHELEDLEESAFDDRFEEYVNTARTSIDAAIAWCLETEQHFMRGR